MLHYESHKRVQATNLAETDKWLVKMHSQYGEYKQSRSGYTRLGPPFNHLLLQIFRVHLLASHRETRHIEYPYLVLKIYRDLDPHDKQDAVS